MSVIYESIKLIKPQQIQFYNWPSLDEEETLRHLTDFRIIDTKTNEFINIINDSAENNLRRIVLEGILLARPGSFKPNLHVRINYETYSIDFDENIRNPNRGLWIKTDDVYYRLEKPNASFKALADIDFMKTFQFIQLSDALTYLDNSSKIKSIDSMFNVLDDFKVDIHFIVQNDGFVRSNLSTAKSSIRNTMERLFKEYYKTNIHLNGSAFNKSLSNTTIKACKVESSKNLQFSPIREISTDSDLDDSSTSSLEESSDEELKMEKTMMKRNIRVNEKNSFTQTTDVKMTLNDETELKKSSKENTKCENQMKVQVASKNQEISQSKEPISFAKANNKLKNQEISQSKEPIPVAKTINQFKENITVTNVKTIAKRQRSDDDDDEPVNISINSKKIKPSLIHSEISNEAVGVYPLPSTLIALGRTSSLPRPNTNQMGKSFKVPPNVKVVSKGFNYGSSQAELNLSKSTKSTKSFSNELSKIESKSSDDLKNHNEKYKNSFDSIDYKNRYDQANESNFKNTFNAANSNRKQLSSGYKEQQDKSFGNHIKSEKNHSKVAIDKSYNDFTYYSIYNENMNRSKEINDRKSTVGTNEMRPPISNYEKKYGNSSSNKITNEHTHKQLDSEISSSRKNGLNYNSSIERKVNRSYENSTNNDDRSFRGLIKNEDNSYLKFRSNQDNGVNNNYKSSKVSSKSYLYPKIDTNINAVNVEVTNSIGTDFTRINSNVNTRKRRVHWPDASHTRQKLTTYFTIDNLETLKLNTFPDNENENPYHTEDPEEEVPVINKPYTKLKSIDNDKRKNMFS